MDHEAWEGIALEVHRRHGFAESVDAFDLAEELRLRIEWAPIAHAERFGRLITLPARAVRTVPHDVQEALAHECGHVLLDEHGEMQSERAAWYLGAALMVPRAPLDRRLRRGWDLEGLLTLHPNVTAELLARRIVEVRRWAASLAVYDERRGFRYRTGRATPHPAERRLVREALESGSPARLDALSGAWPVVERGRRRVLLLASY